jgi:hypothetical protein
MEKSRMKMFMPLKVEELESFLGMLIEGAAPPWYARNT